MPCGLFKTDTTVNCTGGVAVIHDEEAIMITFRGTVGGQEMNEEQCKIHKSQRISPFISPAV